MRILAISGSLRAASSNTSTLMAISVLAPPGTTVALYQGIGTLPHFNPDLDTDQPPHSVYGWRRDVGLSDGLLFCSPEYAHGIAGSLKNALDWLVSSPEFQNKPFAIINASPRSTHANAQLIEVLKTMNGQFIKASSITLPILGRNGNGDGNTNSIAIDGEIALMLRNAIFEFVREIGLRSASMA